MPCTAFVAQLTSMNYDETQRVSARQPPRAARGPAMAAQPSETANVPGSGFWSPGRIAAALALLAGLAVIHTLGDPGITVDEPLDVRPGRTYVATLWARGAHFFDRDVVTQ